MPEVDAEVGRIDVRNMKFPVGSVASAIIAGKETTGIIKAEYAFHILLEVTTEATGAFGVNKGKKGEYTTSVPKSAFLCGDAWIGGPKRKTEMENEVFLAT